MARRRAAITKAEFAQLFKEQFGREYDDRQLLVFLTADERELVMAYVVAGRVLDQLTYRDAVTNLTYEVFYDFDYDADQAVVAYALLGEKKVRLTRGLRQRMTQAAYDRWLTEASEDTVETVPAPDCAFMC